MSIRTNPMKAVPKLLKRLVTTEQRLVMTEEQRKKLNDLKSKLDWIQDVFSIVKKNEEELLDTLTVIDGYLRNSNISKLTEEMQDICTKISNSTKKLLPADEIKSKVSPSSGEAIEDLKLDEERRVKKSEMLKVNYDKLDDLEKSCFLSLLFFPENSIMKKRNIILWWHGAVSINMNAAKEKSEDVFDKLMEYELIVLHGKEKFPIVNKFKINPCIHHKSLRGLFEHDGNQAFGIYSQIKTPSNRTDQYGCLALDQHKAKISDELGYQWRGVFNVRANYLDFGPQWMAKMNKLEVLQLGRWLQNSPKHHIEVGSEEFLKELKKGLKYLSLRGISRISQLPPSIFQLESLETLDLKACHNLETLPDDIASLKNLVHLDLSQCYLLGRMPKGIEKLTKLEVLKGFVKGSPSTTPCKISDLAHLTKLKQLSIHIGSGAEIHEREFESLGVLSKLEKLKISWGVFDTRYRDIQINLPLNLKKLHLEGFPGENIPKWLEPYKLGSSLIELSITGGKLKLKDPDLQGYAHLSSSLQIIRLKHLKL